jgi:uncharacterized protein (DUF1778 family)
VSLNRRRPFLALLVNGTQIGQWTVRQARTHALAVLEASECVDLDSAYRRYLVGVLDIEHGRAINVVDDLESYRDAASRL